MAVNYELNTINIDGTNISVNDAKARSDINDEINNRKNADTNLQTQINNNNTGSIYERLHGKVIIGLGDSLMIGSKEAFGHTWLENIQEQYGAICHNYGVSGSPIAGDTSDAMNQRLDAILDANNSCDYFILEGGANDKNQNIHIGSINSEGTNTVMGAVMYIIKRVRSKYGKNCHILGMTTYHRYDDVNDIGLTEQNYVDAVMLACSTLGIPCFNNYNNAGISLAEHIGTYGNYNTWADVGFTGGGSSRNYHFSKAGYEYLTPIYASFIANGYCNNDAWRTLYTTVDNKIFTKTIMPNGISIVTASYQSTNINVHDLQNHIAYANIGKIDFPNGFRLKDVHDIQITTAIQSDGCLITVSNATSNPFEGGYNHITLNATILYVGESAPQNLSGKTYVTLIGFDE